MNINAKPLSTIDYTRMDNTTALGFFVQMNDKLVTDTTLTAAMGTVWTAYTDALQAFDDAYAQARKWAQTADLEELDKQRDTALSGYLQTLKVMTGSPNAAKQAAAKQLQFIRDKYSLSSSDEYMKETTAISQMIQEIEASAEATAALATTNLDEWLADLKQKNADFLAKMNERTEVQAGLQKGIVREKRNTCEAAYRNVVKLINAMSICEVPAGYSFGSIIDLLNAEIEHYKQILARKGGGGSSSGGNSGGGGTTPSDDQGGGGGDQGGGGEPIPDDPDPSGGGGEPIPDDPDPSGGGGGEEIPDGD